jgi:hypothetical protein
VVEFVDFGLGSLNAQTIMNAQTILNALNRALGGIQELNIIEQRTMPEIMGTIWARWIL